MYETISHSEAELHSRCEWAHRLNYGYGIVSNQPNKHLDIGTAFHEMVAAFYEGVKAGDNWDDCYDRGMEVYKSFFASEKIDKIIPEYVNIAFLCFERYVEHYNFKEWEIYWVEQYIEVPVDHAVKLNGVIDLVALIKTGRHRGRLAVIDHKSCFNFMDPNSVGTHSQIPKYVWAVNELKKFDKKVTLGIINQVRWREIKIPTPEKVFRRIEIFGDDLTQTKQESFIEEYKKQAHRIHTKRMLPIAAWERHSTRTTIKDICKYCDYAKPCITELEGRNPSLTLSVYFTPKDLTYREQRKQEPDD